MGLIKGRQASRFIFCTADYSAMDAEQSLTLRRSIIAPMNTFERYLTLWVLLCIVAGIALGQALPGVFQHIGRGVDRGSGNARGGQDRQRLARVVYAQRMNARRCKRVGASYMRRSS